MDGAGQQARAAHQFGRRAHRYATSAAHFDTDSLKLVGMLAGEDRHGTAIDIATGPGFTAFEVAPFSGRVLATDPALEMLRQARRLAGARGLAGIAVAAALAEALPLRDECVDLLTCRTAPHHFASVGEFLGEAARVLRPGGVLILADTSSPEDRVAAGWMNDVERRRDPTHVRNMTDSEWRAAITSAGLQTDFEATTRVNLSFRDWTERAGTPRKATARLARDWRAAPRAAVEAFGIERVDGAVEDFEFAWPVFVCRARKL